MKAGAPDAPRRWTQTSDADLHHFVGPSLISNRLSNGKGAGRLRRPPVDSVALAPLLGPRLTLEPNAFTGRPLITRSSTAPSKLPLTRTPSLFSACPCATAPSHTLDPSLSAMGIGLIPSASPPPSFCYLSISKSWSPDSAAPSPPEESKLITIAVPPNTQFIRSSESVRLSSSFVSSSSSNDSPPPTDFTCGDFSDSPASTSPTRPRPSDDDELSDQSDDEEPPFPPHVNDINTAPPPERQWVMVHRMDQNKPVATLSVLCYNVLCDKYTSSSLYSYCPTWALNWEYRKKAIMAEIRHYDSDIISLQEVETEQFRVLFLPELQELGYDGIFSPKSRAKTMSDEDKKYVDGCAIFWKTDKLALEREQLIEFTQIAINSADGNEAMLNRVMTRDNIALAAVLRIKEGLYNFPPPAGHGESVIGVPIVVCTAHVHWDPEFCDVKLVQTMMLVQKVAELIADVGATFRLEPAKVPTLICGDLNSLPASGVFEYMTKSRISRDHVDFKQFRGAGDILAKLASVSAVLDQDNYHHPLRLDSAYDTNIMPFTNYTLDFKGIIDYIFTTPSTLYKLGVLGPLDPAWLRQHKIIGCPHPHVPSDHIPLLAQYALIPPSAGGGHGHGPPQQTHHQPPPPNPFHHHHQHHSSLWSHAHT